MFRSLILLSHLQIIQTEGSYSFLLCGMIIACIGFILFIGLLLFHRMHRNYLTGTASARILRHSFEINNCGCAESLFVFVFFGCSSTPSPNPLPSKQEPQKSQPWWRSQQQSRTGQSKQNRSTWKRVFKTARIDVYLTADWWRLSTAVQKSSNSVCKCIFFCVFCKSVLF